ncbi:hypothetical protein F0562_005167 [Nyssa sinensis]|uniref:Protein kinase domain-containing protein n=1 Tax=Nyssa sinensis TaxID=561372 RepID=A0A5J5AJS6_9ASTE|nr:hypothetical protein F0562_005167 [Nyssa sinensis]
MSRGTLRDHLYDTENTPLSWKQRLEILIGAARGLHYLHAGAKQRIIHRDVKTTNILLDERWVAKVSDFGLSKINPTDMSNAHVSTLVKGSFGYLDPEYYRRQQLTEKSDVYSFGVVLLEVLCARRPLDNTVLNKDEVNLSRWARQCYEKGTLDQIIDPYLTGKIVPESLKKFGEIAVNCVDDEGIKRPSMNEVVWSLEFALKLQENAEEGIEFDIEVKEKDFSCQDKKVDESSGLWSSSGLTVTDNSGTSFTISDLELLSSGAVFSEINFHGHDRTLINEDLILNPQMLTFAIYLISFFLRLILVPRIVAANTPPYTPTDYFLLSCGSPSNKTSSDGRNWDGDVHSKFSPSNMADISSASTAAEQDPSVTQVPYLTARIFNSQFTYTFPVSAGPKFVRLYFYPATYSGLDKTKSFFSVAAGDYTLLSNFSAFLTVADPKRASLIKEFIVNVMDNQKLYITFSPSPNSFAFVNGIEVVSMPNNLYLQGDDHQIKLVMSQESFYYLENNTALETLYRLNVGGSDVTVNGDTGMFRTWHQDDSYIYGGAFGATPHLDVPINYTSKTPPDTAPAVVYTTSRTMGNFDGNVSLNYNLTWVFTVDSGFYYLVRLHFCEFQLEVTRINQRVFSIFINNQTADIEIDVIQLSGGTGIPIFRDYVIEIPLVGGRRSKQDLWLALHPYLDAKPKYGDAILNGLEIFKLNQSDGNLGGPNPALVVDPPPPIPHPKVPEESKSKGSFPIVAVLGGVLGGIAVLSVLGFLIFRLRRRAEPFGASMTKSSWVPISVTSKSTNTTTSSLPAGLCRHFSLAEIKSATCNFDKKFVIGTGGFGDVYKGYIDNAMITVAIKRLNPSSNQGAREFHTEIGMLSKLRHLHLVSLIGYCDDDGEMILVYDYMGHGTLRDHLYKTKNPPLPWKQRLQICIGAARGLHYLHAGADHTIIHRDVKSTNILLDEKWVAKVSDFGLSKWGPTDNSRSHVSTVVKGSFGYVDPEYFRRQQLTDRSDVYSFGVVLFEVLCARPPIIASLPKEQLNLAEWGRYCFRKGTLDRIVDPNLKGQIAPECLRKFGEIAVSCVQDHGIERPTMNDVVWSLEFALQLQETTEKIINGGDGVGTGDMMYESTYGGAATTDDDDDVFSGSAEVPMFKSSGTSTASSGGKSLIGYDHDGLKTETIFSEMMNPKGR